MRTNHRQEAVALLLAVGHSVPDAARESGVSVRTIRRWLASSPEFRQLIVGSRDRMFQQAANRITAKLGDVTSKLEELTNAESEYVRIKAARTLADLGIRLRQDLEVESRLQELERQWNSQYTGSV